MRHSTPVDERGRYFHWDEQRFRKPPAGFNVEEYWMATRMARNAASQPVPISDKEGNRFSFCEPPSLKAALRDLDMNAGGALASDVTALSTGEGRLYLARSLAEEPFASSLIEGAATTREIAKKLIFEGRLPRTKDELMVINNYRALEFVKSHKTDKLTLPMLLELHRIVTAGTLPNDDDAGRIRTHDNIRVVDEVTNEILHQPPIADELDTRLARVIKLANRPNEPQSWIHPIVKAIILHFALSYEHPFVDGNGRVARALFYWSALKDGYWLIEYVSISSIIAESKIAYGKSFLHVETDDADLTYFLIYNCKILQKAMTRLSAYIARRREEVKAFEKRLGDHSRPDALNHRQSWLLNECARGRRNRVTIGEHAKQHGVSYLTARSDLERLTESALLRKSTTGRSSLYQPPRDLLKRLTSI
jgi:Fic family protein